MAEKGIDISKQYPKDVDIYLKETFDYVITVYQTGNATFAATSGNTSFNIPFTPVRTTTCTASNTAKVNYGTGQTYINGNVYIPTIPATNNYVCISGTIFLS